MKMTVEVCKEKLVEMDEDKQKMEEEHNQRVAKLQQQIVTLKKSVDQQTLQKMVSDSNGNQGSLSAESKRRIESMQLTTE